MTWFEPPSKSRLKIALTISAALSSGSHRNSCTETSFPRRVRDPRAGTQRRDRRPVMLLFRNVLHSARFWFNRVDQLPVSLSGWLDLDARQEKTCQGISCHHLTFKRYCGAAVPTDACSSARDGGLRRNRQWRPTWPTIRLGNILSQCGNCTTLVKKEPRN